MIAPAQAVQGALDDLAVVVPIKSFASAKARLAEVLGVDARAALARTCASRVLSAAAPHRVFVVCDDEEVAAWAGTHGASVVTANARGSTKPLPPGVWRRKPKDSRACSPCTATCRTPSRSVRSANQLPSRALR